MKNLPAHILKLVAKYLAQLKAKCFCNNANKISKKENLKTANNLPNNLKKETKKPCICDTREDKYLYWK